MCHGVYKPKERFTPKDDNKGKPPYNRTQKHKVRDYFRTEE